LGKTLTGGGNKKPISQNKTKHTKAKPKALVVPKKDKNSKK